MNKFNANTRRGFSLLELLVALAVLTIIVLMTSKVFQQSSGIWQNAARSDGVDMIARGIVAQIQTDLERAVPISNYTNNTSNLKHSFAEKKVEFVMLRDSPAGGGREVFMVLYECKDGSTGKGGEVTRTETPLEYKVSTGRWAKGTPVTTKNLASSNDKIPIESLKFKTDSDYDSLPSNRKDYELPRRIDIEAAILFEPGQFKFKTFAGRSFGPNKIQEDIGDNTVNGEYKGDDIFVGGWE